MRMLQPVRKILLLLVLASASLLTRAQDPAADLKRMTALYRTAKSYSMDITATFFSDDAGFGKTHQGKACKDGDNYFSQLMGRTTIFNSACRLLVDEDRKLILYNTRSRREIAGPLAEEQLLTDSAFYASARLKYVFQNERQKKIEVKSGDPSFEKMEIVLNAKTFALEQVIYYYGKQSDNGAAGYTRAEISYSDLSFTRCSASIFSEKNYINRSGGKWVGKGKYASYKIIDQSNVKYRTE